MLHCAARCELGGACMKLAVAMLKRDVNAIASCSNCGNNAMSFGRITQMSDHYHDENDLKLMRDMRKLAPDDFNAWLGLNNIIGRDNGAIPKKYRELIALAVSATTQCPYCMEAHAKGAHA